MSLYRHVYHRQKHHAKMRGITFLLSFEEWLTIWTESGRLAERGRGKGKYVMARNGDVGPYAAGNVRIITFEENCSEQVPPWIGRHHSADTKHKLSLSKLGNTHGRGNRGRTVTAETSARHKKTMVARGYWFP